MGALMGNSTRASSATLNANDTFIHLNIIQLFVEARSTAISDIVRSTVQQNTRANDRFQR